MYKSNNKVLENIPSSTIQPIRRSELKNFTVSDFIPIEEEVKEEIEQKSSENIIDKYAKKFAIINFEKKKRKNNLKIKENPRKTRGLEIPIGERNVG